MPTTTRVDVNGKKLPIIIHSIVLCMRRSTERNKKNQQNTANATIWSHLSACVKAFHWKGLMPDGIRCLSLYEHDALSWIWWMSFYGMSAVWCLCYTAHLRPATASPRIRHHETDAETERGCLNAVNMLLIGLRFPFSMSSIAEQQSIQIICIRCV